MTLFKLLVLAMLAYITTDFLDPSVPGVFFFASDQLFVDSALQTKLDGDDNPDHRAAPPHRTTTLAAANAANRDAVPSVRRAPWSWRSPQKQPAAKQTLSLSPSDDA